MFETSKIELSKSALKKNLTYIKRLIGDDVKFSSVIKGNAYGHGIEEFVAMAEDLGVDHFSVFSADEAFRLFDCCDKNTTVMVMGMLNDEALKWAIDNGVHFFVFENDRLQKAVDYAKEAGKKARVHLEIETGLNRTGFNKPHLNQALKIIRANSDNIEIEGVCTHYAGAESIGNYLRIKTQIKKFNKACKWLEKEGIEPKLKHTACSAAVVSYPKTHMDMVRVGIMQYGYWPSKEILIEFLKRINKEEKIDPLERIISWKSEVMSTKNVETGEFIGYGNTFMAANNMKIATVPVGYGHGYSRSLSNIGRVLINGERFSVVGIVNMNVIMVDISDQPDIQKGDEVVLIGKQKEMDITVHSFSELSSQLNYELLTRLPGSLPRKIVD